MNRAKEYLMCFGGALLVAVGVYFFKFPNNFSTGGVSGVSVILSGYFQISSASTISTIINMALLLLGFVFLGHDCGIKTVIGTVTLSGALMLFEKLFPLNAPLTDQPFLELVYAIFFPAMGSAILFNCSGSTGGTDIVAMILKKHTSLNIGSALVVTDIGITLGAFLFGAQAGLYSLLGLILKTAVIDTVIENINLCKCFYITTDNPDEISEYITKQLNRSCSVVEVEGAYTHKKRYMLICAMRRYQAAQLRRYLKENFPTTFMMITNSSEVIGKGFRGL